MLTKFCYDCDATGSLGSGPTWRVCETCKGEGFVPMTAEEEAAHRERIRQAIEERRQRRALVLPSG